MKDTIKHIEKELADVGLTFLTKPILIGGRAMEYYDMRKSGDDIDLVITNEDYQSLAGMYPDSRKDLYGDLGVTIGKFEIWRSIAHLDYSFFSKEAVETDKVFVISIERLLWSRVCAMKVEKYRKDLDLLVEYYYKHYTNADYHKEAAIHEKSYAKNGGSVFGGKYED
ncbi:MAG TPA: hypothetical protein VJY54_01155 [Lachnospiraceae bacterium]|nr:hypothetical protein [Lachnospiraceae bacterium]